MDKKAAVVIAGISLFLLAGGFFIVMQSQKPAITGLDDFAKCLDQKGAVMYGAYWCSHCQSQKKTFGDSFKFIKYVECTQQTQLCQEKNVSGYPTWEFADGTKLEGEQPLDQLSKTTGCQLPQT
ncbi:hypothetical protein A2397_04435 [Candidatus Amesbacteria bacterium RIFOXYB1_FULL_44_23]|uniref:Thioredoxin domain-containing protein n=1 Tax=Candidatus Amesbacteria bacterium RIFOXYB1_FULL_44_23 TaxID=1797263 RepID=A0A1F4ZS28_9BACT|nr:MAG: hypothetical protein A2397_04435 [Candidatus Amesbacteria bacterium RIFOXYB1_FULL_44_23]